MARAPQAAQPADDTGDMPDMEAEGQDTGAENEGGEGEPDVESNVVVTIARDGQGGYLVFAGDEPEAGEEAGETEGEGGEQAEGEPQGQPASGIGQALHIAMTIMQEDASKGEGTAHDNFRAGFGEREQVPQETA